MIDKNRIIPMVFNCFRSMLILALLVISSCKNENEETIPVGSFEGVIKDQFDSPLDSVVCQIVTPNYTYKAITNETGWFKFTGLNVGTYTLNFSKKNYVPGKELVEVKIEPIVDEFILTAGDAFLSVSDSLMQVNYEKRSREITINSNTKWEVVVSNPWLKSTLSNGIGTKSFTLSWEELTENTGRDGLVTIKSGSLEKILKIKQHPPFKLISTKGVIGNYETGVNDSVHVQFNLPFTVTTIKAHNHFCITDIKYKITGNRLSFSYPCADLGNSYSFTISVKEKENVTSTGHTYDFSIPFYEKKHNIPGYIYYYFITDDNTAIWAVTEFPSRLLKINLSNLEVVKSLDLDFKPTGVEWNNYKKKIHLYNSYANCSDTDIWNGNCPFNKLIYIDPDNLSKEVSEIKPMHETHDPYVYPKSLGLMKNGIGIVLLSNGYAYNNWRFINSAKGDSTYIKDQDLESGQEPYSQVFSNFNHTRLIMKHSWGGMDVDVLEMGSHAIRRYKSPFSGYSRYILPSKKSNMVLNSSVYVQFITDLDGYVSKPTYMSAQWFRSGEDFSYRPGEEQVIYNFADGLLQILDYKNAFTRLSIGTNSNITNIKSTTDGKHIIAMDHRSNGSTDIIILNVDAVTTNQILSITDTGGLRRFNKSSQLKSAWVK